MRHKFNPQTNLFSPIARSSIVKELEQISLILDATQRNEPRLPGPSRHACRYRRKGMTAEQVLRCAVLKQYRELTYEDCFHLRTRMPSGASPGSNGTIPLEVHPSGKHQGNQGGDVGSHPSRHPELMAIREKIGKGRAVRVDSRRWRPTFIIPRIQPSWPTASASSPGGSRREGTHAPTENIKFSDHQRVVKKRVTTILNARKDAIREKAYRDLLHYANWQGVMR